MKITSQAFTDGGKIPDKYTMYGDNKIPPLHLDEVPEGGVQIADPEGERHDGQSSGRRCSGR